MNLPPKGEEVSLNKIEEICEFYGLRGLWEKIERDPPQRPFKSDGCSLFFDSWEGISLYPACFLHDLKYWSGYPGEDVERLVADAELMIDVARLVGGTKLAETMFFGVRVAATRSSNNRFPGDLEECDLFDPPGDWGRDMRTRTRFHIPLPHDLVPCFTLS